jgi:hypothetical protein
VSDGSMFCASEFPARNRTKARQNKCLINSISLNLIFLNFQLGELGLSRHGQNKLSQISNNYIVPKILYFNKYKPE